MKNKPIVIAQKCSHKASDQDVYNHLADAVDPLDRSWRRLKQAKTIAVKFNQDLRTSHMFEGNRRELVSDSVARAVLRLLRERTDAEIICVDASYFKIYRDTDLSESTQIAAALDEFDVRYVDCTEPAFVDCPVPGGGGLFSTYKLNKELVEADEVVSVAKMKNHKFMGITGSLKNLFGLMPAEPHNRPRAYYHHLVRMPYMLTDIGKILDPALNIVDALVGQASSEWSFDEPNGRVVDAIIAGDHPIATDVCMTHIMGHDPSADWLTDPFLRDRNSLRVAAENGYGTNRLEEIDFQSNVERQPSGAFFNGTTDSPELIADWRRTMCEQALQYRDNRTKYSEYNGQYILLQKGEVVWSDPVGRIEVSRRTLAGKRRNESLYFKFVDSEEKEEERYAIYEDALQHIKEIQR